VLAEAGANLLDVEHQRTGKTLHLDEVEVEMQLETRGSEHADVVVRALTDQGYAVYPV
jgi:threonine dehydratase